VLGAADEYEFLEHWFVNVVRMAVSVAGEVEVDEFIIGEEDRGEAVVLVVVVGGVGAEEEVFEV